MTESSTGIAEPETTADKTNMTMGDYQASRSKQLEERSAPQEEVQSTEIEEESEVEEVEVEAEADEVLEEENVLSQFDLDNLSQEDAEKLSEILKSRAAGRIGQLTGEKKSLQGELNSLKESIKNRENPLDAKREIKDNPFGDLKDTAAIQTKSQEIHDAIEYLEDVLYDASDDSPEDIVVDVDGQQLTKSQVREQLKQARKSRDTFLPDQYKKVQEKEKSLQQRRQYGEKAMKEFEWMKDSESTVTKQFVKIASDSRMQKIYDEYPELGAQLPYLLAHAVNSINSKSAPKKTVKAGKAFDIAPPKSPNSAAAPTERSESRSTKVLSDLNSRFKESGSKDDFIKMRMQKRANNGKI
tara:strand:- start:5 stop:1072 length:1068 start_codon:yes stop_codon:yes gene_type:complete